MPKVLATQTDEVLTQLATRIPQSLHRRLKLYCVANGVSIMEFLVDAIDGRLSEVETRPSRSKRRAAAS